MKIHSLEEYAQLVHYTPRVEYETTLQEIQDYFEDGDYSLWDYPLEELRYCIEENRNVVVVEVTENEFRLCEI